MEPSSEELEEGELVEELEEGEILREEDAVELQEASQKMLGIVRFIGHLYK